MTQINLKDTVNSPVAVAHRLKMPAALFEAFAKSMLGGKIHLSS